MIKYICGIYEACTQPEAKPIPATHFHLDCPSCRIALEAALIIEPLQGEFTGFYYQRDRFRELIQEYDESTIKELL